MSYVITGAAGHLGRRAAELLLDRVAPAEAVLVTRRPDELADLAARGADVRFGDFDDAGSLATAFAGGDRLLLISTDAIGSRIAQHGTAIDAARAAGVQHISYTSVGDPSEDNPAGVVPEHRETERLLAESGVAWTSLRMGLYSEYRIPEAEAAAASGTFGHNQGDGRTAYVARTDCAAAAVAVLTGGPEHDGVAYDVTGPELLGAEDLARLFAEAGGTPVTAQDTPDEQYIAGLVGVGLPEPVAALVASFGTAIRGGHLAQHSTVVEDLTGLPPLSVASVLAAAQPS